MFKWMRQRGLDHVVEAELAEAELALREHQLQLLMAERAVERARAMIAYNEESVARLRRHREKLLQEPSSAVTGLPQPYPDLKAALSTLNRAPLSPEESNRIAQLQTGNTRGWARTVAQAQAAWTQGEKE